MKNVLSAAGRMNGMLMVSCEDGEAWSNLPMTAEIHGQKASKDSWNSDMGMAFYRPIPVSASNENPVAELQVA